jgi:hypothetical protein
VSPEFAGVLKQKPVRGVGVDFDPRLGNETGQQIGKVRQDHRVAVTRGDEHRMTDRADSAVAAGVDTTFQPWAHGLHVWPVFISAGIPESALAIEDLASFFRLHARSDTAEEAAS